MRVFMKIYKMFAYFWDDSRFIYQKDSDYIKVSRKTKKIKQKRRNVVFKYVLIKSHLFVVHFCF